MWKVVVHASPLPPSRRASSTSTSITTGHVSAGRREGGRPKNLRVTRTAAGRSETRVWHTSTLIYRSNHYKHRLPHPQMSDSFFQKKRKRTSSSASGGGSKGRDGSGSGSGSRSKSGRPSGSSRSAVASSSKPRRRRDDDDDGGDEDGEFDIDAEDTRHRYEEDVLSDEEREEAETPAEARVRMAKMYLEGLKSGDVGECAEQISSRI